MSLSKRSVQTQCYQAIRSALVEGRLPTGKKITNRWLAEMVGASVTPIREAIRRLVSEGALVELPNGSVMVPPVKIDQYVQEQSWLLTTLEARLTARAAERIGISDLAYLEAVSSAAAEARRAKLDERVLSLWHEFYSRVFSRADAELTRSLVAQLWTSTAPVRRKAYPLFDRQDGGRHFAAVLSALRNQDPGAAALAVSEFHAGLLFVVTGEAKALIQPKKGGGG